VVSNTSFTSAFFPGEVGLSQEQVIGEVKFVSAVESIELKYQFGHFFFFNIDSVEESVFSGEGGPNVVLSNEVVSIAVDGLERFNEESEKISPFLEADFVVVVSIGSLEKKFDFSEGKVVVLIGIEELV